MSEPRLFAGRNPWNSTNFMVVHDLSRNAGWVSVGVDHDTAEFAVESIRRRGWCSDADSSVNRASGCPETLKRAPIGGHR